MLLATGTLLVFLAVRSAWRLKPSDLLRCSGR